MTVYDYLVVGSGCSGAIAAQTLVDRGVKVVMLDAGTVPKEKIAIPDKGFLDIRRTDRDQYKYFVGEGARDIGWGMVGKGEGVTYPRKYMVESVDRLAPIDSSTFASLESLGYGGLGISWGLQCWEYSKSDLKAAGLSQGSMSRAYQFVADKIGVSATNDEAIAYTLGSLKRYQKSPTMDRNHQAIYSRYLHKKSEYNQSGLFMGRTPLALITKNMDGRKQYSYKDMDFYSDADQSAWRPWITINKLKKKSNFSYIGGFLILSFTELDNYIELTCLNIATEKHVKFYCRKLILATSTLGTSRIVLRSLGEPGTRLPLLCNPYTYIPSIQPRFVGKAAEANKLGFTQLSLFYDPDHKNNGASVASLYSYQSLMLFRLIRHVPLDFADARIILKYLLSGVVILGIHHPDHRSETKYVELSKNNKSPTNDILHINYSLSDDEKLVNKKREKAITKAARMMGVFSLKHIDPGNGASIHYAGTLPFSFEAKPFSLSHSGRIHGTRRVYVADSSGFKYLPAPGLTFSLMANAHLVAENVLSNE